MIIIAFVSLIIFSLADIVLTHYALGTGQYKEGNWMAGLFERFGFWPVAILGKLVLLAFLVGLCLLFPAYAMYGLIGANFAAISIVLWNLYELS